MIDVILVVACIGYVVLISVALSTIFVCASQMLIRSFFAIAYPCRILPTISRRA